MTGNNSLPWLVLQMCDSSFPVGGFAHSAGLEAALQLREAGETHESLLWFCSELVNQCAYAALPFVNSAYDEPESLASLDRRCDVFLSNHVANRASRVQGRAFLTTCCRAFELPGLGALKTSMRDERLSQHFAPLFGAVCKALGIGRDDTRQVFLFLTIRGVLSAAVRLNAIGAYAAQQLQLALSPMLDRLLDETMHLTAVGAAQTAPLLEVFQMTHDRLYSRLFQS
jgi:urease accessory protein